LANYFFGHTIAFYFNLSFFNSNFEFNINKFNCKKILKKISGIVSGAKEVYIKLALYLDTVDGRITMDISRFLNKNKLSKIKNEFLIIS